MTRGRGQVLVLFALLLPMLLLPIAAYAVDSSVVAAARASLQATTAAAAEAAAQRIDVDRLRATGTLEVDPRDVSEAVTAMVLDERPKATVDGVSVAGSLVTVMSSERVMLPLPLLDRAVVVTARATARIVPGYDSPSSFIPLSTSNF